MNQPGAQRVFAPPLKWSFTMNLLKAHATNSEREIVLPPSILAKLGIQAGQWVEIEETENGFAIAAADAVIQRQLAVAEKVMRENHVALRRLADS
jgi:bifunctional DNA-binding transcriptional regulator/antitoxin component of YhaV-PrlF toxin-antitoxin module